MQINIKGLCLRLTGMLKNLLLATPLTARKEARNPKTSALFFFHMEFAAKDFLHFFINNVKFYNSTLTMLILHTVHHPLSRRKVARTNFGLESLSDPTSLGFHEVSLLKIELKLKILIIFQHILNNFLKQNGQSVLRLSL